MVTALCEAVGMAVSVSGQIVGGTTRWAWLLSEELRVLVLIVSQWLEPVFAGNTACNAADPGPASTCQ